MAVIPMHLEARATVLDKAAAGIKHLIQWAQQTPEGKLLPKTATWTYEACRHVVNLGDAGSLEDIARVYQNCVQSDSTHLHVDKSRQLYSLPADAMNVAVRWGIFRAPLPFMRDRCVTYVEATKFFIDAHGRRGFARYIRSHPSKEAHHSYVGADIRSWGVVIVETADPAIFIASSTVDIDWKGSISSRVATTMTSRRAQSIKKLASVVRASAQRSRYITSPKKPNKLADQGRRASPLPSGFGHIYLASDSTKKAIRRHASVCHPIVPLAPRDGSHVHPSHC
ncbi:hypothetical protein ACHHYP_10285 [Achlya hypogyna]|uniref:Uncharacterized protein n=1 Tax=Achlya hypogyna TaxID=1202772 RepID=A0A1V9YLX1_ACHHY|nr:hypothetical protein ACHHYP_10285 [Achlya hypogyna]